MNLSLLLTILGLLLTIVFGFLSIDLFKRKRYPGKITFVRQANISLFNSIVKNFQEISILFESNPIKENLIYIKGSFINDGDIDIEGEKIEKPISLTLPKGLRWVNCKITSQSKDFICKFEIHSETDLEFIFGLFRKSEFFQIEAIIEALDDKLNHENIFEELKFQHRIANTQKISVTTLLTESQMKNKKGKIKSNIITTAVQMLLPTVISLIFIVFLKSADIHYKYNLNGQIIEYKAAAKKNGQIELTDIATNEDNLIPIEKFQKKENYILFIPDISIWQRIKGSWYIIPIYFFLVILFIGFDYWELRKSNKIYKILKP